MQRLPVIDSSNDDVAKRKPFPLAASHFVVGLIYLAIIGVLLPFAAAELARGRYLQPLVLAAVHSITLGWLTLSIMGALCQILPHALRAPLHSSRLALLSLGLFAPGIMGFVAGFLTGTTWVLVAGACLLSTGLILFIYNAVRTVVAIPSKDLTGHTLLIALGFLAATIGYGLSLAINSRTQHLGAGRVEAIAVHVHVAVAGWVGLVVMAVGRRLLPAFLGSTIRNERALRVAIFATTTASAMLALLHRVMTPQIFRIAAALLVIGWIAFVVQVTQYVIERRRPELDAALQLAIAGVAQVFVAILIGVFILAGRNPTPQMVGSYGIALLGGLLLFVAGHYYKILPSLFWNYRFAPFAAQRPVPRILDLFDPRVAQTSAILLMLGFAGMTIGVLLENVEASVVGAFIASLGCILEAAQLLLMFRRRLG